MMWQIFTTVERRISSRVKWYKNYKNRLRFAKVIVKNKRSRFFMVQCVHTLSSIHCHLFLIGIFPLLKIVSCKTLHFLCFSFCHYWQEIVCFHTQWTAERSVFGAVSLWFFCLCMKYLWEPLNGFAPHSNRRRVWCLARTSLKVTGTKNGIFRPFRRPAAVYLVNTFSLYFFLLAYCCF